MANETDRIGLLSIAHPRADLPGVARSTLRAGGITLLERNVRLLRQAGAAMIYIVADQLPEGLGDIVEQLRQSPDIRFLRLALDLAGQLDASDHVLMIEEGVVVDERIVSHIAGQDRPAVAVWPIASTHGTRAMRLDAGYGFGSMLGCRGDTVLHLVRGLGEWDMEQTLLRAVISDSRTSLIDLTALGTYAADRAREVPLVWQPMSARPDEDVVSDLLGESVQKEGLDWPARFLHQPLETAALRTMASLPLQARHLNWLRWGAEVCSIALFAHGWFWPGLLLALAAGPLVGLADKLARVRVTPSAQGNLNYIVDKIMEFGWCAALAFGFYRAHGVAGPAAIAAIIVVMGLAQGRQETFFRRYTGIRLRDYGQQERTYGLFAGHRNTYLWTLVPFALTGHWYLGFAMVGIYAILSFFWGQWRFFERLQEVGSARNATVTVNSGQN